MMDRVRLRVGVWLVHFGMGVMPFWTAARFSWREWPAELYRPPPFNRCDGCDGYDCIERCEYPGSGADV